MQHGEFAKRLLEDIPEFALGADAVHERSVRLGDALPVQAVHVGIVERVPHVAHGVVVHLHPLGSGVDGHRPRLGRRPHDRRGQELVLHHARGGDGLAGEERQALLHGDHHHGVIAADVDADGIGVDGQHRAGDDVHGHEVEPDAVPHLHDERVTLTDDVEAKVLLLLQEGHRDGALLDVVHGDLGGDLLTNRGVEELTRDVELVALEKRALETLAKGQAHELLGAQVARLAAARPVRRTSLGLDLLIAEVVQEESVGGKLGLHRVVRRVRQSLRLPGFDVPDVHARKLRRVRRGKGEPLAVGGPRVVARSLGPQSGHDGSHGRLARLFPGALGARGRRRRHRRRAHLRAEERGVSAVRGHLAVPRVVHIPGPRAGRGDAVETGEAEPAPGGRAAEVSRNAPVAAKLRPRLSTKPRAALASEPASLPRGVGIRRGFGLLALRVVAGFVVVVDLDVVIVASCVASCVDVEVVVVVARRRFGLALAIQPAALRGLALGGATLHDAARGAHELVDHHLLHGSLLLGGGTRVGAVLGRVHRGGREVQHRDLAVRVVKHERGAVGGDVRVGHHAANLTTLRQLRLGPRCALLAPLRALQEDVLVLARGVGHGDDLHVVAHAVRLDKLHASVPNRAVVLGHLFDAGAELLEQRGEEDLPADDQRRVESILGQRELPEFFEGREDLLLGGCPELAGERD